MATISSLGTGSGLDLEGILTKLMTVESQPLNTLASKEAGFQSQLTAYGTFKSSLATLQTAAQKLADKTVFTAATAASADSSILSASATSGAAIGSYTVKVGQLAQAQVMRSNTAFSTTSEIFNTGLIAITVGSNTTNVTINSGNNTLTGIRDAINAANSGVTASLVNDGTNGNYLVLSSNTTGATAGAVSVSVAENSSTGTSLAEFQTSNLYQLQAPQDAKFNINNLDITRSSNTVSDVINGVTLNLSKAGTLASPVTTQLNVVRNTGAAQAAIATFVSAYNDTIKQIKTLTAYDSSNNTASVLTGDSTLRSIQEQLSGLLGTNVSGLSGNISSLTDIGVGVSKQKDGSLSIDTTKLSAALSDTSKDVAGLLTSTSSGNQGVAVRLSNTINGILGSGGMLSNRTDGINRSIKDIGNQRNALNLKLTKIEATYRAQFLALDATISSMQSTSNYLTQQLDYLKALATGVSSTNSTKVGG